MTQPRYIIYGPPSPYRRMFLHFLLTQAGQAWEDKEMYEMPMAVMPSSDAPVHYTYPVLEDREAQRRISQVGAIVLYLLDTHGIACDRVEAMRLIGDAETMFAEILAAKTECQTYNDKAWGRYKYRELPVWMRMHNAWLHTRDRWESEAVLMAALWCPLCDFLPTLLPIMAREAPSLYSLVDQVGNDEAFLPLREQGELKKRMYFDPFRDGTIRKMDDEAGPEPDPLHERPFITHE